MHYLTIIYRCNYYDHATLAKLREVIIVTPKFRWEK